VVQLIGKRAKRALRSLALSQGRLREVARLAQIAFGFAQARLSPRKERLFGMTVSLFSRKRPDVTHVPGSRGGLIIRLAFALRASWWDRLHNSICFWEECLYGSTSTERF
jgi:hypothetical protein